MTRSVDITDHDSLHAALRLVDMVGLLIDGTTTPPSLLLKGRRRATYGDTVTRHDDGTVSITKTQQEGLF